MTFGVAETVRRRGDLLNPSYLSPEDKATIQRFCYTHSRKYPQTLEDLAAYFERLFYIKIPSNERVHELTKLARFIEKFQNSRFRPKDLKREYSLFLTQYRRADG